METNIQPKPKRTVSFEVDEKEARQIAGFLKDAFAARLNTPYSTDYARKVMYAFNDVAEGR